MHKAGVESYEEARAEQGRDEEGCDEKGRDEEGSDEEGRDEEGLIIIQRHFSIAHILCSLSFFNLAQNTLNQHQ